MVSLPRLLASADQVTDGAGLVDLDAVKALLDAGSGSLGGAHPKASVRADNGAHRQRAAWQAGRARASSTSRPWPEPARTYPGTARPPPSGIQALGETAHPVSPGRRLTRPKPAVPQAATCGTIGT